MCVLLAISSVTRGQTEPPPPTEPALTLADAPASLDTVPVPKPEQLAEFVRDETALQVLGKALFWDMQVGSDGKTACASCHAHAGADVRLNNTLAPAANVADFPKFRGANKTLAGTDFPFHKLENPLDRDSAVLQDTSETVGSAGVVTRNFDGIVDGSAVERGFHSDSIFTVNGANARQVTSRNAPTIFNAVLFDRLFWDGRASRFFNGVNVEGDLDPNARVYEAAVAGQPAVPVKILLDNAAMASLATGPPLSDVEMSFKGRTFPDIGRKMLQLRPLALQKVHQQDSLLGPHARLKKGLRTTYAELIRKAFQPKWWQGSKGSDGFTQMESNFSLYWGLAIQAYQSLLISDDAPYDRWQRGDESALTDIQKQGLLLFMNEGRCSACHDTPAFTIATRQFMIDNEDEILDRMDGAADADFPDANEKLYDIGFNNTAVRPTVEDNGQGGSFSPNKPFSLSRRAKSGMDLSRWAPGLVADPNEADMTEGSFKIPSLRNIELTGPYMHNGGMRTLEEVVDFYVRGTDFFDENSADVDNDVHGIPELKEDTSGRDAIVAFMKSLTDDRVRRECAPFDHPELIIPDGHTRVSNGLALDRNVVIPAVGSAGGEPLKSFAEILPADGGGPPPHPLDNLIARLQKLLQNQSIAAKYPWLTGILSRLQRVRG